MKSWIAIALGCTDWHLFRNSGMWMQGGESVGTGAGIKIGIKKDVATTKKSLGSTAQGRTNVTRA